MAEDPPPTAEQPGPSEVEILANALAKSSEASNASNTTTVRVLGTLLALSVCGNIALAGLQIRTSFMGQGISMGEVISDEEFDESWVEESWEEEPPPREWCVQEYNADFNVDGKPDKMMPPECFEHHPDVAKASE